MTRTNTSEPTPQWSRAKRWFGRVITCRNCGLPGGTMMKVPEVWDSRDALYEHQDKQKCRILQLRRTQ